MGDQWNLILNEIKKTVKIGILCCSLKSVSTKNVYYLKLLKIMKKNINKILWSRDFIPHGREGGHFGENKNLSGSRQERWKTEGSAPIFGVPTSLMCRK